jgi:hypothetical protein
MNMNLIGTIPNGFFASFPRLTHLHLNFNGLTGTVPDDLKSATNLEVLSLAMNFLTGMFQCYCKRSDDHMIQSLAVYDLFSSTI